MGEGELGTLVCSVSLAKPCDVSCRSVHFRTFLSHTELYENGCMVATYRSMASTISTREEFCEHAPRTRACNGKQERTLFVV